jgi:hypothetical protein
VARRSHHSRPANRRTSSRSTIVIGNNGCFERFVIFGVLQRTDHRLGREPMANGIAAGTLFAFFGNRTGTFTSIATVGLDLAEGSHRGPAAVIGFVPRLLIDQSRLAFPSVPTAAKEVALSLPILSGALGSGCVSSHSARAVMVGSTPAFFHHAASSPKRWASR